MADRNGNHRNGRPNGQNGLRRRRRRQRRALRLTLLLGSIVAVGFTLASLLTILGALQAGTALYASFAANLPPVSSIDDAKTFKTVQIYDRHGTLLWEFWEPSAGMRTPVAINQISQHMIDATLGAEDPNFYTNPGIEPRSIVRAVFQNVTNQEVLSGASTITQQLVRNVLLLEEKYERSISRKLREALLAWRLTQEFPKDRILELYLNEIYYGNMAYGVEAAALTYFGKHARDLTVAEAALIAGLPQAPSLYDPYRNKQAALERRSYVLDQMARHGFITQQQAELGKREPLALSAHKVEMKAPHWVNYIRQELELTYGPEVVYRSGLRVFTTLDLGLHEQLRQVAQNNREYLAARDANNTAIVAIYPKTGEILAMVGSMDYWDASIDGQVNVLVSERQPGSSIKPLVYMMSFLKGWNPATVVMDTPSCWTNVAGYSWCPVNWDHTFRGPVPIRMALGNSMNIPAVRALEYVGVDAVKEFAPNAGITTWGDKQHVGLSLTLGGAEVKPLELAGLYATLANNGRRVPPVSITKIVDARGNVLEEYRVPPGTQVVDPRAAYMITHILKDPQAKLITYGPNTPINLPRPAAVKTGTTDNFRDTWTMGYTPNLVIGAWVGNSDGHPMRRASSHLTAGKVWREAFDVALAYLDIPPQEFARPEGLTEVEVCGATHLRPGGPPCYKEIFMAEQAPRLPRIYLQRPPATPTPEAEGEATPVPPTPTQPAESDQNGRPQPTPVPATATPRDQQAPPPAPTPQPQRQPEATPVPQSAVQMPVVRGMRVQDATTQLQRMGFQVQTRQVESAAPAGIVADQSPPAGATLPPGATVTLLVSAGN